jgi:hypothetical protein
LLAACSGAEPPASTYTQPTIVLHADTGSLYGAVDVVALPASVIRSLGRAELSIDEWQNIFALYTGGDPGAQSFTNAVMGRYRVEDGVLRFAPRFPPVRGQVYYARFDGAALQILLGDDIPIGPTVIDTTLVIERQNLAPTTSVTAVYPSDDSLPVNLLRMYVHFSAPMSVGEAQERIRLLDGNGNVVADGFLNFPEELWDPERRRITLLLDPGRIKRGVRPNVELGAPLRLGESYTLQVDGAWRDARGLALREGFEKRFTAGPEDRAYPLSGRSARPRPARPKLWC